MQDTTLNNCFLSVQVTQVCLWWGCDFFFFLIITEFYGTRLSHIFEIPSISNKKPSILIEIPSISIKNLGFRSKYLVFRIRNIERLGCSHLEFEIPGISSEVPGISKKVWNPGVFIGFYVCPLASASVAPTHT